MSHQDICQAHRELVPPTGLERLPTSSAALCHEHLRCQVIQSQVFDELHRDPDITNTRIGEARIEPRPCATMDYAMIEAIKDAMKQPS
jgi:hypothetical protein